MALNKVILMGRLTRDPEFRQTTSGIPVCRFSLAIDRPAKQGEEKKADFIDCTAWRNTAEFITRFFTKGRMIIVEGSLHNNNYTDNNGVKHYSYNVLAQNVQFGETKAASEGSAAPQQNYQTAQPQQMPQYGSVPAPNGNPYVPQQQPVPQAYTQMQQQMRAPQAAAPAQNALSIGDLGEFEEILSDGEVPF